MYVLCAPGKNSGACCHFLFQGILIQGSNPCFWCLLHILHWQADSEPTGFHVSPAPPPHTQNQLHSNGVSKPEGGLLQNCRLEVSYGRIVNYRPQGKNFQQGKSYQWQRSRGKGVHCISYKNWLPQQLSQWELVITLELWLFFPNQPSQPLTFLYNVLFLCWTSLWLFFFIARLSQIAITLLFLNKFTLACKITFIFKVNSCKQEKLRSLYLRPNIDKAFCKSMSLQRIFVF